MKVVIAAGGTAGHVVPALAVAGEAQEGAAPQASRMVQFIPGGTGKDGIIPIQTIRME